MVDNIRFVNSSLTNPSISDTLGDIWDRAERWRVKPAYIDRAAIEEMRWKLDLLEYQVTPKPGWSISPAPVIGHPICSEPGCKAGRREGLYNHAGKGFDPVWYCLDHLNTLEHTHHVPGSPHSKTAVTQLAEEMSRRWPKFLEEVRRDTANQMAERSAKVPVGTPNGSGVSEGASVAAGSEGPASDLLSEVPQEE